MVDGVLELVTGLLAENGISAFREFPGRAPDKGLCVTVGARECKVLCSGMGDYIGLREKENGDCAELYGKRAELEMELEIFASFALGDGAGACAECADRLCALMEFLPEGLMVSSFVRGETTADETLSCFRCVCRVFCLALFYAEPTGEQGEFLDFILKGVVGGVNK